MLKSLLWSYQSKLHSAIVNGAIVDSDKQKQKKNTLHFLKFLINRPEFTRRADSVQYFILNIFYSPGSYTQLRYNVKLLIYVFLLTSFALHYFLFGKINQLCGAHRNGLKQ